MTHHRALTLACAIVSAPLALGAQSFSGSVADAIGSITQDDVADRIGLLAHDSMRGRDTPSPELEQTADYIAGEFRRLGLSPAGDNGTFLQRYGIVRRGLDTAATRIAVTAGSRTLALKAGRDVNVIRIGPLSTDPVTAPIVLLAAGDGSAEPPSEGTVGGAWAAFLVTATPRGVRLDTEALQAAVRAGAAGILLISNRPADQWASRMARVATPALELEREAPGPGQPTIVEITDGTAERVLGLDMARERASAGAARRIGDLTLTVHLAERVVSRVTAPNVVGILEGSDPALKAEHLVYSAHMDHVGVGVPVGGDSIFNGADDDASGTAAVLELAEAFTRLRPRPKRSMIFLTVSGEEKGLWGSAHFTADPPVPLSRIVANVNMDMVGRNWKDTIAVIGKEHSDLGATLDSIAAAHPELRMTPVDDRWPQEQFYFRSDHYNFARRGVPILFFFNGTHADYHQPGDEPSKIDAEKEARIVRLVFYLGLAVANAAERPRWKRASYEQIVEHGGE